MDDYNFTLKKDEAGNVVLSAEGHPVYLDQLGAETACNFTQLRNKVIEVGAECKSRRELNELQAKRLEAVNAAMPDLKANDPDFASFQQRLSELQGTPKNIVQEGVTSKGDGDLQKQFAAINKEKDDRLASMEAELNRNVLEQHFSASQWFNGDKTALPAKLAYQALKDNFKVEVADGRRKVIPLDTGGQPILSKAVPGEVASFDDAIELILEQSGWKDQLTKFGGKSGSGAISGSGGAIPNQNAMDYEEAKGKKDTWGMIKTMMPDKQ